MTSINYRSLNPFELCWLGLDCGNIRCTITGLRASKNPSGIIDIKIQIMANTTSRYGGNKSTSVRWAKFLSFSTFYLYFIGSFVCMLYLSQSSSCCVRLNSSNCQLLPRNCFSETRARHGKSLSDRWCGKKYMHSADPSEILWLIQKQNNYELALIYFGSTNLLYHYELKLEFPVSSMIQRKTSQSEILIEKFFRIGPMRSMYLRLWSAKMLNHFGPALPETFGVIQVDFLAPFMSSSLFFLPF